MSRCLRRFLVLQHTMPNSPLSGRSVKKLRAARSDSSSDDEVLVPLGSRVLLPPPITIPGVVNPLPGLLNILLPKASATTIPKPMKEVPNIVNTPVTLEQPSEPTSSSVSGVPVSVGVGRLLLPNPPMAADCPLLEPHSISAELHVPHMVAGSSACLLQDTQPSFPDHHVPDFSKIDPKIDPAWFLLHRSESEDECSERPTCASLPESLPSAGIFSSETSSPPNLPKDMETDSNSFLPLHEGSEFSVNDCMISILTFCQTNHLSGASTSELLNLVSMLLHQPNNLPKTSHLFNKFFKDDKNELLLHYICSNCWSTREAPDDICDKCCAPNRKVTYFVSCPLDSQLQRLYSRPGFCELLKHKHTRVKQNVNNIEDIYDSSLYKEEEKGFLSNGNNISLTWYSDGISLYECSLYSAWPCIFTINELPRAERYKMENILMGGLWGANTKPHPNIFLSPIYNDVVKLRNGVNIQPCNSETILVCAKVLFGTCDMPAKSTFLNMKSHCGYYSCAKCFIKGEKSERTGQVMVFPHDEVLELRTDESHHQCVQEGVKSKDGYLGVFGPSLLTYMFGDNFISGMSCDVMHAVYMGIMKKFMKLWFDPKYKGKPFSVVDKIPLVNKRLLELNLPHFVQRLPIEVDKNLCYVKASLSRNYFLYIFPVVLKGVLPDLYYKNFCKVVEGVSLLNQSSISSEDIKKADILLNEFSQEFQDLYGLRHMTANIHSLRHLAQCVIETGNLFLMSCFEYEGLNGELCDLAHGTRHAISQMGAKLSMRQDLPLVVSNVKSDKLRFYCKRLMRRSKNYNVTETISDKVYVVGDMTHVSPHSGVISQFVSAKYGTVRYLQYFDKLYKFYQLFVSSSYVRGSRNSSVVKYYCRGSNYHGKILTFTKAILSSGSTVYLALVQRSLDGNIGLPRHVKLSLTDDLDVIPVHHLTFVCFYLVVENQNIVVDPLNLAEME